VNLDKVIGDKDALMCDDCEFTENKNNFLEAGKNKVKEEFEKSQAGIEYETPGQ
jgi:hypothetical protein